LLKIKKEKLAATQDPLTSLLHSKKFPLQNDTELANEPVDPGTEQNQTGPSGQDIEEFRIIWAYLPSLAGWVVRS